MLVSGFVMAAACGNSSGAPTDGTGGDTSTGGDGSGGEPWVAPSCSVSPYHFTQLERPEEWHTESSECPPGPLFTLVGRACEGSWDFCEYRGRRYTGYATLSINSAGISCDSRITIGHTTICCDEHDLDPCPPEAQEGSSCTPEERGECYVPGPGANIEHGFVNGQICACDPPGPKWRCATICQLCDEGLHSLDPENFDRVDCAPEDAFGGAAGTGSGE